MFLNPKLVICINKVVDCFTLNKKYPVYDYNKEKDLVLIQNDKYCLIWRHQNEFEEIDIKSC